MSSTIKKIDHRRLEMDLERINTVKKKLFLITSDDEDVITNTCKKSEKEENTYNIMMTFKEKMNQRKKVKDILQEKETNKKMDFFSYEENQQSTIIDLSKERKKLKDGLQEKKTNQEVTQNKVSCEANQQSTVDLTRKRKRQPEKWKRNIIKKKREAGEEYINIKGDKKQKKMVQSGCEQTCNFNCTTKITATERENIRIQFYSLNDDQKYKYYNEYTERKQTERKRTQNENSRRKHSFVYYLPCENIKNRVCKKFFCSTLDISVKRIYHFYKKKDNTTTQIMPTPKKGRYVKKQTDIVKIEEVINHIKSFPVQESHYCRATSKREYLDPNLSIAKMYSLYIQKHKEPVKENIYRKVFNENFNLSFHQPKKDTCDICCEYKAILNPDEDQQHKYKEHIIRKQEGDEERARDRQNNKKNTNTAVITFDLENIFSLPKANVSCFYYTSKLTVYNLTGHCNIDNSGTNAIWDETKNGRSGDEIASALIKILVNVVETLPNYITKIILWSDSCVPQNKNSHMSMALINFLQSVNAKNITEIEQKFSEPGHGNVQEVDCVHSVIERSLRHQEIYSPLGLMRALTKIQSKIRLKFLQMEERDFRSFHDEAIKLGFGQIPYKKIKPIKYNKMNWNIVEYKTNFTATTISTDIKQSKVYVLSDIVLKKAKINSLTDKKIQDIRSVYKFMPPEDKNFMEALIKKVIKYKDEQSVLPTGRNTNDGSRKNKHSTKQESKSKLKKTTLVKQKKGKK